MLSRVAERSVERSWHTIRCLSRLRALRTVASSPVAEPSEQADRKDAEEKSDVHPCRGGVPVHASGVPRDRAEFQDREHCVTSAQRPDSEEVVLPVRMERGEPDPN